MPDPSLSAALQEAYAAAPSDVVILHTLDIRHPAFDRPIRVVRNFADEATWTALGGDEVHAVLDALDAAATSQDKIEVTCQRRQTVVEKGQFLERPSAGQSS